MFVRTRFSAARVHFPMLLVQRRRTTVKNSWFFEGVSLPPPPGQITFHVTKRQMCSITNGFDSLPVERQYKIPVYIYNVQDTSALKFYNYINYITEQCRKCHGLYGVNDVVKSNKKIFILSTQFFNSGIRLCFRLRSPNEV